VARLDRLSGDLKGAERLSSGDGRRATLDLTDQSVEGSAIECDSGSGSRVTGAGVDVEIDVAIPLVELLEFVGTEVGVA